jgi:hypothetical protein
MRDELLVHELHCDMTQKLGELHAASNRLLDGMAGAQEEAALLDLLAVLDAVLLTRAASAEIGAALDRYKRASAPMAEPKRGSSRMFK